MFWKVCTKNTFGKLFPDMPVRSGKSVPIYRIHNPGGRSGQRFCASNRPPTVFHLLPSGFCFSFPSGTRWHPFQSPASRRLSLRLPSGTHRLSLRVPRPPPAGFHFGFPPETRRETRIASPEAKTRAAASSWDTGSLVPQSSSWSVRSPSIRNRPTP